MGKETRRLRKRGKGQRRCRGQGRTWFLSRSRCGLDEFLGELLILSSLELTGKNLKRLLKKGRESRKKEPLHSG